MCGDIDGVHMHMHAIRAHQLYRLSIAMYAVYVVFFAKLFADKYVFKTHKGASKTQTLSSSSSESTAVRMHTRDHVEPAAGANPQTKSKSKPKHH
jgi:hypothetical protein